MTNYEAEQAEYEALLDTPEAKAVLQWKPMPAAPVAPCFDPAWLPPVLGEMAQAVADNLSVPIDLPALVGLGVSSSCAAGVASVRLKHDWIEPAHLFLLCVMESGDGKTPAFRHMTRRLYAYQLEENRRRLVHVEQDKASVETLHAQKAAAVKKGHVEEARRIAAEIAQFPMTRMLNRFIGGDVTPERMPDIMRDNGGATAVLDDEGEIFDILCGRYSDMPNLAPFLHGHSGGKPLQVERKGGGVLVEKPSVAVLELTQPYVLNMLLANDRMLGKGFLARFLIACPAPVREYGPEPDLPAAVVRAYEEAVNRLLALPKDTLLTLSPEAAGIFMDFRDEARRRKLEDWQPAERGGYASKLPGNVARLAACLHLWEGKDAVINAATMRSAVAVARYFMGHLLHLLGTESGLTAPAKEALALMVKQGQPAQMEREIKRKLAGRKLFRANGTADAALDELEKAGYIRREQEKGTGRPVLLVRLHPDLLPKKEVVDL